MYLYKAQNNDFNFETIQQRSWYTTQYRFRTLEMQHLTASVDRSKRVKLCKSYMFLKRYELISTLSVINFQKVE